MALCVENDAHSAEESAAFLLCQVPSRSILDDVLGPLHNDVKAALHVAELAQFAESACLDASVGYDGIEELHEAIHLDLEAVFGLVAEERDKLVRQALSPGVVALLGEVEQGPQKQVEALNGALSLADRRWQRLDQLLVLQQKLKEAGSGLWLRSLLEALQYALLEATEAFGVFLPVLVLEGVRDGGGHIDADVLPLTRTALSVSVFGCGTEGGGELVDEEGGDLGELGQVALA